MDTDTVIIIFLLALAGFIISIVKLVDLWNDLNKKK